MLKGMLEKEYSHFAGGNVDDYTASKSKLNIPINIKIGPLLTQNSHSSKSMVEAKAKAPCEIMGA